LAFFLAFSVALNLVLTVLLISQLLVVRDEVRALPDKLVTKDDVAALRPLRIQQILDSRCARCHTDRRFAAALGWERQAILDVVARMATHPGANVPPAEFESIQASLTMLQCTRCHTEAVPQPARARDTRAAGGHHQADAADARVRHSPRSGAADRRGVPRAVRAEMSTADRQGQSAVALMRNETSTRELSAAGAQRGTA
jgi:hypothetical protein